MFKSNIYIYTPNYDSKSNGIRIIYYITSRLRALGYNAYNVLQHESTLKEDLPFDYSEYSISVKEQSDLIISDDDIVFYVDHLDNNNPLNAKRIVRFLGNIPMNFTGIPIEYGETDYLLAFNKIVGEHFPQCYLHLNDTDLFKPLDYKEKENTVVIYYGKVNISNIKDKKTKEYMDELKSDFDNVVEITRYYPSSRKELADLLRSAKLLVSFDSMTLLNLESTLCNTPVLLMDKTFYNEDVDFNIPLHGFIFNYNDFEYAKKVVNKAFPQFLKTADENDKTINNMIENVISHFNKIYEEEDVLYTDLVKRSNKLQLMYDPLLFEKKLSGKIISNIFTLEDLDSVKSNDLIQVSNECEYIPANSPKRYRYADKIADFFNKCVPYNSYRRNLLKKVYKLVSRS